MVGPGGETQAEQPRSEEQPASAPARSSGSMLKDGKLDEREVEIEVTPQNYPMLDVHAAAARAWRGRTSTSPRCCRR